MEIPSNGSITLDDIADRTSVLAVACNRCDRAGPYDVNTLIARHGPWFSVPDLVRLLSEDCPKRRSLSNYDMCGAHCPELPALFPVQPR